MDRKPSNPDTDSFVDDRMARLAPSPDWKPDAGQALERLNQRRPSLSAPWMRLAMTATILAATVFVLVLLPWQRLWTPKPVAAVAAQTQTTPAEKPVEKAQEAPTPQQPAETAPPQAPAPPTAPQEVKDDALLDLPDNEKDLLAYLEQLTKKRGVSPVVAARVQTAQADSSEPQVIRTVLPEYSDQARQERIQGTVEMVITVKADGTVQFESFKKTLGYGLDEKAREAVERWVFAPAKKDGVAVAKTITVSTNFSLR